MLKGAGYVLKAEGAEHWEELTLWRRPDGSIVYRAVVLEQNSGTPVDFPLVFFTASSWTFENLAHDFPQTIEYWLADSTSLRITLSGPDEPAREWWFVRASESELRSRPSLRGYEVLVCNRKGGAVERFDAHTGNHLGRLYSGPVHALCSASDGSLYVLLLGAAPVVLRIDPAASASARSFLEGYALQAPSCLAFGPDGHLYVGQRSGEVLCFEGTSGRFIRKVAEGLPVPVALAWDAQGHLLAACAGGRGIWRVPIEGNLGHCVTPEGSLKAPTSLCFAPTGEVIVADADEVSLKRFRPGESTWTYLGPLATGFGWAEGLVIGPDGFLYSCDVRVNVIKKIDPLEAVDLGIYIEGSSLNGPSGLVFRKK